MVFATGGHWTVGTIPVFKNDSDLETQGYGEMLRFYEMAMEFWTDKATSMLEQAKDYDRERGIVRKERQIIVRGYGPGHADCNDPDRRMGGPVMEFQKEMFEPWNWKWILRYNKVFQVRLIFYLSPWRYLGLLIILSENIEEA